MFGFLWQLQPQSTLLCQCRVPQLWDKGVQSNLKEWEGWHAVHLQTCLSARAYPAQLLPLPHPTGCLHIPNLCLLSGMHRRRKPPLHSNHLLHCRKPENTPKIRSKAGNSAQNVLLIVFPLVSKSVLQRQRDIRGHTRCVQSCTSYCLVTMIKDLT